MHTTTSCSRATYARPDSGWWRLRSCEQVNPLKKERKPASRPPLCRVQQFRKQFSFPTFFFLTRSRCSTERERARERDASKLETIVRRDRRSLQHRLKEGKKERKKKFPSRVWTRREKRDREGAAPATHDAGGVGVSQIQIRSRCSRDTHPPCLRSDTRADLHVRGRVASPRIAVVVVVIDTFSPLPFAPVSVKSRMHAAIDILRELRPLRNFIPEPARSHDAKNCTKKRDGISRNCEKFRVKEERKLGEFAFVRRCASRRKGERPSWTTRPRYLVNNVNNLAHDTRDTRHFAFTRAPENTPGFVGRTCAS